jgi:hypothetical protein
LGKHDESLAQARAALEEYDYEAASEAYARAMAAGLDQPAFLEEYAGFLVDSFGQYQGARELLEARPRAVERSVALQRALVRAAWLEGAGAAVRAALARFGAALAEDDEVACIAARVALEDGELAAAGRGLQALLKRSPGHVEGRRLLGEASQALAALEEAALGRVDGLLEARQLDQAEAAVAAVLARAPESGRARQILKKIEELRAAERASELARVLLARAGEEEQAGREAQAVVLLEQALEAVPGLPGAREHAAELRARLEERRRRALAAEVEQASGTLEALGMRLQAVRERMEAEGEARRVAAEARARAAEVSRQEEARALRLNELRRAVEEKRGFEARRRLAEAERAGVNPVDLAPLAAAVAELLEDSASVLPAVPVAGDAFERFPLAVGGYARVGPEHLAVLAEGALLLWDLASEQPAGVWDLPPAFARQPGAFRLLARGDGTLFFIDFGDKCGFVLEATPGRMARVLDRFPLERVLATPFAAPRISVRPSADGLGLVVLVSSAQGERRPRLTLLDGADLRVAAETEFPFQVQRLVPVEGRPEEFGLSRLLVHDPSGQLPRWDFAVVGERGRVARSLRWEGLLEPINAVRAATWVPQAQRYVVTFDFFDPFSGQVSEDAIGLGILNPDLTPFFLEARMEDKLRERRRVVGDARVLPGQDRLLLPWRDRERNLGLAWVALDDPSQTEEVAFGRGDLVLDLYPRGDGRQGHALVWDREARGARPVAYSV